MELQTNTKRQYTKFQDVVSQLRQLCRRQLRQGNPDVPSERELASIFAVSLMTVRKAVENCISEGMIIRSGRRTTIAPERPLAKLGKILFLSGNGVPVLLPAFERLWLILRHEVEKLGGQIECLVDIPTDDVGKFRRFCDEFNTILLSPLPMGTGYEKKIEYLKELALSRNVIALSDPYTDLFPYVAALDNYEVGKTAAQYLNQHNCRRALVLGCIENLTMFEKRLEGFRSAFAGTTEFLYRSLNYNGQEFFFSKELKEISAGINKGVDGIFFATDECTPLLTDSLFTKGLCPNSIKIITVNGSGECYQCLQPLPNISHSNSRITAEAIALLCDLAAGKTIRNKRRLVLPNLHANFPGELFQLSLEWKCREKGIS